MQAAPLPAKLISDYTTDELLDAFQIELRPNLKYVMDEVDEQKGIYNGHHETTGWLASCWPKRIRDIPGDTPREAVENCLKKMDVS